MRFADFRAALSAVCVVSGALGTALAAGPGAQAVAAETATIPAAVSPEAVVASRSTDRIKDLTTTLVLDDNATNRDELAKIGGSFATTYSFREMRVGYAYPNKARFEGVSSIGKALLVYNGDQKMFKVPIPLIGKKIMNVHGKQGQKQSLLDVGVFARDWLTTDWEPHYEGRQGGLDKYDLKQRDSDNRSHEVVFVNPKTYIIERRLSYNGSNILQKEMRFTKAIQIQPGIWVPGRIEIYNQFGKLGAAQDLTGTRVNAGVSEDLFQIQ